MKLSSTHSRGSVYFKIFPFRAALEGWEEGGMENQLSFALSYALSNYIAGPSITKILFQYLNSVRIKNTISKPVMHFARF
jgi:hypothetical protein